MTQPLQPIEPGDSVQSDLVKFSKSRLWTELLKPKLLQELEKCYTQFNSPAQSEFAYTERGMKATHDSMLIKKILKYVDAAEDRQA